MALSASEVTAHIKSRLLVLDGATGTELERRGVCAAPPLWSAAALLTAPQVVEQVHRDYVAAGADILVANTFRTNPRTLRSAGCARPGALLNRLAVDLARRASQATSRPVIVAASVGPVEDCYHPERVPSTDVLRAEHAEMMDWLVEARPDLIWIETMNTLREACIAAQCAAERGLPAVVSFVTRQSGELLSGEPLSEAVAAVAALGPLAIGLNCIPPCGVSGLLERLRVSLDGALAAYAHINNPVPISGWNYSQSMGPEEYGGYVRQWLERGATIVGGCCGTTPAHIEAVRRAVDTFDRSA